jgi:hypothetical protein
MRGRAGIRAASALAAALAATMLVAPAGAEVSDAADEDRVWKVDVWGHPFEPYAQIPEELQAGSPGTWSQLEGALPTRCEALGTLVDTGGGGVTVDMLAYEPDHGALRQPGDALRAEGREGNLPQRSDGEVRVRLADLGHGVGHLGSVPERAVQLRRFVQ